jgi:hypothetical protein
MDDRLHRSVMPNVLGGAPVTVQRFNDAAVQAQIESVLGGLKSNSAIVKVHLDNEDGLRGVAAAKIGGHWSVGLVGELDRSKRWDVGAYVGFEW